jgi:hypothetical protein
VAVAGALVLATVVSVLLRTGDLHAGFWIDEGIAVGIAQHVDWRDALARLRAGVAPRPEIRPGRRIVLVTPVDVRSRAPWGQAVRARTREWRVALAAQLCRVGATSRPDPTRYRSTVRAEIFTVCRPPRA